MFDTGSPALWIMDECIVTEQCSMTELFDSATSKSLTRSRESWGMVYGAGEVSGVVASDLIGIGDMSTKTVMGASPLSFCRLTAGLVSSTPNWGNTASGLVGFGPASSYAIPPWWAGVNHTWPEQRFGFFVGKTADWISPVALNTTVRGAGSVTLGGVDPTLFEGELQGTPANITKWWTVGIEGVRINGAPVDIAVDLESEPYGEVHGLPSAMLDTGLSVIVGPTKAVERVYAAIPGAFQVPESETYFIPRRRNRLEFCFAGGCWPATALDATDCRARADMLRWFPEQIAAADRAGVEEEEWCAGTLFPGGEEAGTEFPQWSLGDAFLQHNYVAHQLDPPEVQIARISTKAIAMVKEANIGLNRQLGG